MQSTITPVHFFAATDLIVVGQNPENADYDNPRGDIIGSAAFIYAEDAKGYRVRKHVATGWEVEVMEQAEREAAKLNVRLTNLGKLPVGFSSWLPARPGYGSEAYIESGQSQEDALLERMEDEELAWN